MTKIIAPSVLAADFSRLGDEVRAAEAAGVGWIHLDVMDGHFVPNLTMGPALVKSLRSLTTLPFDAHLMVERPADFVEPFAEAGADYLSIHVEAENPSGTIELIEQSGCKPGVVLNPPTPFQEIVPFLERVAYVLVMTVNPGFAGQSMIQDCVDKISMLVDYRREHELDYLVQVDGGVNLDTIERVKDADIFVAGNGIFKTDDYAATVEGMLKIVGA